MSWLSVTLNQGVKVLSDLGFDAVLEGTHQKAQLGLHPKVLAIDPERARES
jgi:hypothetical protein